MTRASASTRLLPALRAALAAVTFAMASAHAGEVCVSDGPTLVAALQIGTIQTQGYTIKLQQGSYFLNQNDFLQFALNAPTSIEGGYTAGCADRNPDASNTNVFLPGTWLELTQPTGSPTAALSIDGITFRGGSNLLISAGSLDFPANQPGVVSVSRSRFTQISSTDPYYAPVLINAISGSMDLSNVQFDHVKTTAGTSCPVMLAPDDGTASLAYLTVDLVGPGIHDLCIGRRYGSDYEAVSLEDSIVWASDGSATNVREYPYGTGLGLSISDSIYQQFIGESESDFNVLHADPKWVAPGSNDYHLAAASPAINAGFLVAQTPATDIEGNPRRVGSKPDMGAYESAVNDLTSFLVTNTNDSGPGSLRAAIIGANSLPNAATIGFSIQSGDPCPSVIQLDTALPAITSPVIIDGYSQQGSSPNADPDAFDAQICILIKPTTGTLPIGFSVPSGADAGSLTLRGIGMGGFSQPVLLLGGKNHVVAGNQFGGSVQGVPLPGASLNAISFGVNAGGTLIVGGNSPADRNLIGGVTFGPAVRVQSTVQSDPGHCQVINNLIGLMPDGVTPLANLSGINLGGNGCAVLRNRIAANHSDGIDVYGNNNLVQRNIIGSGIDDGGYANNGIGINVEGYTNVIGADAASNLPVALLGNVVRHMGVGGIAVQDAGTGNSVRTNLVSANAAGVPAIDLGADGATPNGNGNAQPGPNQLQNFPSADGLYFAATPQSGATDVVATLTGTLLSHPGAYRVDAYYAASCNAGRGQAEAYLGTMPVTVAPGSNSVSFGLGITLPVYQADAVVSLVATDSFGNSSEIGDCFALAKGSNDMIFRNGLEP